MAASSKILMVTTCGARKHSEPKPAWKLYKSSRIRAVYNRRMGHDMCILSTKYGLVEADAVIEPYEAVMTEQIAKELIPQMAEKIKNYDYVVYFRGGAGKPYLNCLKEACERVGKLLIVLGYANMGSINDLPEVLQLVELREFDKISEMKSAQVM